MDLMQICLGHLVFVVVPGYPLFCLAREQAVEGWSFFSKVSHLLHMRPYGYILLGKIIKLSIAWVYK